MDNRSRTALFTLAVLRILAGMALFMALLFLPAGTIDFWQAWLYLALLFGMMAAAMVLFIVRDPELLQRRITGRESQPGQGRIVLAASALIIAAYLMPGLDKRWGWSNLPPALSLLGAALVLLGYTLFLFTAVDQPLRRPRRGCGGRPAGDHHRPLCARASPHVSGNRPAVHLHPAGAGLLLGCAAAAAAAARPGRAD